MVPRMALRSRRSGRSCTQIRLCFGAADPSKCGHAYPVCGIARLNCRFRDALQRPNIGGPRSGRKALDIGTPRIEGGLYCFPVLAALIDPDNARLGAAYVVQGRLDNAGVNAKVFHSGCAGAAQIVNTPGLELAADEFLRLRIPFAAQKLSHAQVEPVLGFRKAAWRGGGSKLPATIKRPLGCGV